MGGPLLVGAQATCPPTLFKSGPAVSQSLQIRWRCVLMFMVL